MMQVTLEKNGSLTLPKAILDKFNLYEGGIVTVDVNEEGISLKPSHSLRQWVGSIKGCYATPEEADRFIREMRDGDD